MLVLCDDLKKTGMKSLGDTALKKLLLYLNTNEPSLIKFLQSFWNNQQRAITYKELRESILMGNLSQEVLDSWRQDYSRFVINNVAPLWADAMESANNALERNGKVWTFNIDAPEVKQWTTTNAARFVTHCTEDQIKAIRSVIQRATQMNTLNVDTLAHVVRPMVGLDWRQAAANMNYFQTMVESGVTEKRAIENSIRYSARQNRARAMRISRTELAFAYSQGSYIGTIEAMNSGMLGHTVKRWCTADDERVCDICGSLEGMEFEMDNEITYEGKNGVETRINPRVTHKTVGKTPPAHPSCRCTLLYIEKSPPIMDYDSKPKQYAVNVNSDTGAVEITEK